MFRTGRFYGWVLQSTAQIFARRGTGGMPAPALPREAQPRTSQPLRSAKATSSGRVVTPSLCMARER